MNTTTFKPAFTPAGQNANNAANLNIFGMNVGVKMTHSQTYGQLSCVETLMTPRQMGPPPHIHYALDEIMLVLEGTVSILEGDKVIEIAAGGYHFRPRGVVHTFWNGHDAPAKFLDMYPGVQDFAHYLEELSDLCANIEQEKANPHAPESIARFKALDAKYNHEVFYEQMPQHIAKYGNHTF